MGPAHRPVHTNDPCRARTLAPTLGNAADRMLQLMRGGSSPVQTAACLVIGNMLSSNFDTTIDHVRSRVRTSVRAGEARALRHPCAVSSSLSLLTPPHPSTQLLSKGIVGAVKDALGPLAADHTVRLAAASCLGACRV